MIGPNVRYREHNNKTPQKHTQNQDLHIAFLDVTKAYDKAWLNAILYARNKSGLKEKEWNLHVVKNINKNLTAKIRTKFGKTRPIKIKDSIRQGGVLSVIEYANLIDEIAKEIKEETTGITKIGDNQIYGCLLWMDDVALIHKNKDELQKMLNITEEISKRYHLKFDKSQTITIGKQPDTPFKLGQINLDNTTTYKYLGTTINNKGTMDDHIKKKKGKTEAALQTIFNIAGNKDFNQLEMKTIWKLVETCIIPTILYAAETWTITKKETEQLQKILDNVVRRILLTPPTTPREILQLETGIWDI